MPDLLSQHSPLWQQLQQRGKKNKPELCTICQIKDHWKSPPTLPTVVTQLGKIQKQVRRIFACPAQRSHREHVSLSARTSSRTKHIRGFCCCATCCLPPARCCILPLTRTLSVFLSQAQQKENRPCYQHLNGKAA